MSGLGDDGADGSGSSLRGRAAAGAGSAFRALRARVAGGRPDDDVAGAAAEPVPEKVFGPPLLEVRGLTVTYRTGAEEVPAVVDVDLTVREGERVAVVGESGSGKSTTAAALIGLLPGSGRVAAGTISFAGEDVTHASDARLLRLRGREVGLVPQDPMSNLNPVMRVGAQVEEVLRAHGLATGRAAKDRAVELLGLAGIPDAARRARQYPHEFSGGMRQRVLIAIALACEPRLLVADEPTSALDVTVQRQILDHLEHLTEAAGTSMLLVTHDLGLAADRADTVVVMSRGRVVESGPAARLLTDPQHEYTRRLVAAAPSVSAARAQVRTAARPDRDAVPRRHDTADGVPVLRVEDVTKTYRVRGRGAGDVTAVDGVSFAVPAGTTTAVVGESGSGKTTLSRMALGLEAPTSGRLLVGDDVVGEATGARRRAVRRAMQPVFQDPYASLDPTMSVERLVDEPLRVFGEGDRASRRRRVGELLDQVSLPRDAAQRRPAELSGGQRQRVAIARALAVEPRLVVLDEAVSALDVLVQDQVLQLLHELQEDLGVAYLFITHDLAVVRQVAHAVAVMRRGRLVEHGPVDAVMGAPREEYTRELLAAIPGADFYAARAG
ncbi:peptide/nickel transport system ATP-binding protein [Pseudokineococcus lusitanus]|uniref:Peptide/nickel transport system ATP-binding protein n=1 Tax=Pseudokineococcus lusitanus TaxID=763993 RepID=A0A3N1GWF0_9ACTN|nr:ABC transporter ATP-binding protein [Pseudokineococcus lusitanus]ROP34580.1 peptide/nickel transport system ATP-binding protein [Pseudokineococcus lusitanus]